MNQLVDITGAILVVGFSIIFYLVAQNIYFRIRNSISVKTSRKRVARIQHPSSEIIRHFQQNKECTALLFNNSGAYLLTSEEDKK